MKCGYDSAKQQLALWRKQQNAVQQAVQNALHAPPTTHGTATGTATSSETGSHFGSVGSGGSGIARNVSMRMVRRASEVRLALDAHNATTGGGGGGRAGGTGGAGNPLVSVSSFVNLTRD